LIGLRFLSTDGDEAIAIFAGEAGARRDERRDVERDRLVGQRVELRPVRLVVLALVGDLLAGPERANELDRFRELRATLIVGRP
jgi:hypothetical protein